MRRGMRLDEYLIFVMLILIALVLAVVAWLQDDWDDVARGILVFGALVFLAVAFGYGIQLWQMNSARIYNMRTEAEARTAPVLLAEAVCRMKDWQVAALDKFGPGIIAQIPEGYENPGIWHTLDKKNIVTLDFIRRVVNFEGYEFMTIREIDKADRDMAQVVMSDFIARGWVSPARGNQSAKWINKAAAIAELEKAEAA